MKVVATNLINPKATIKIESCWGIYKVTHTIFDALNKGSIENETNHFKSIYLCKKWAKKFQESPKLRWRTAAN